MKEKAEENRNLGEKNKMDRKTAKPREERKDDKREDNREEEYRRLEEKAEVRKRKEEEAKEKTEEERILRQKVEKERLEVARKLLLGAIVMERILELYMESSQSIAWERETEWVPETWREETAWDIVSSYDEWYSEETA